MEQTFGIQKRGENNFPSLSSNYIEMPKLSITPAYVTEILILSIQILVPS